MNAPVAAIVLVELTLVAINQAEMKMPYVGWTMDGHMGYNLTPRYTNDEKWTGDLRPILMQSPDSGIFKPGKVGNAIYVEGNQFVIGKNLSGHECLINPGQCAGITITFWIRVDSWKANQYQSILRTTTTGRDTPGVYLGHGNKDDFLAHVQTSDGKFSNASISITLITGLWAHIVISWDSATNNLSLYLNQQSIRESRYVCRPVSGNTTAHHVVPTNCVIGHPIGPKFYLDELYFYNVTLTSDDIRNLTISDNMEVTVGTSFPHNSHRSDYVKVILLATLLPASVAILSVVLIFVLSKKRRSKKSLRNYVHQTSVQFDKNKSEVQSDTVDEVTTDADTDVEMERLNSRLLTQPDTE